MSVSRTVQQSLRRCAFRPSALSSSASSKFAAPAIIAAASQRRSAATTQNVNQDDGYQLLVKQRLARPVAPHLSIYKPQVTWYLSAMNRITGCTLSGAFYVFGFGYLVAPLFGWHLESSTMAAAFGSLSLAAKLPLKFLAAMPFTFHCANGVRHLMWDLTWGLKNKYINQSGWVVVGLTFVGSAWLATVGM